MKRDGYTSVKVVGKGGQGFVELWVRDADGVRFAAKIFEDPQPGESSRVIDEARMLMTLKYPSLVQGYDVLLPRFSGDSVALVMENMEGGSLDRVRLDPTEQNGAVISIAKGLAFLHSRGIVHRDLKPANILLTKERFAKIGDFGSARAVELGLTQSRVAQSTLYTAPEVHEGSVATFESDMWAYGLIVYEVLTGRSVFDAAMPLLPLLRKMSSDERPEIPASASPVLREIISRCWSADPARRPTAREVCAMLLGVNVKVARLEAFMKRFPVDLTELSQDELIAKVEAGAGENARLAAAVTRLVEENAALKRVAAADAAKPALAQAEEVTRLKAEVARLTEENAALKRAATTSAPVQSAPSPAPEALAVVGHLPYGHPPSRY
jgi:serine/threonine protein kinase